MFIHKGFVNAQTVIFSENFDSSPNWTLNTPGASLITGSLPNPGGSPNTWAINNSGTTIDGTNNLHITCSGFICNILGAPGPVYNASGAANNTNTAATMNSDINASVFTGGGPFTLSFQWICSGATTPSNGSGRLIYSVDGGANWIEHPTNYNGSASAITESIDMSTLAGFTPTVNNIRLGFRWFNIGTSGHNDPPMIVDNIKITIPNVSNTITTGTITGSPFCPGATFSVPFTSTGTFNTGNVYTAQLSDASGSFATPTNIGTLPSTANSGSISVTIPLGTPAGTGYVIRVVSSNPAVTGSSTVAFSIVAPTTPTFNAIGPLCQNATAPSLPASSTNATPITGTWSPATINTSVVGTTTYTFTPNAGQCADNTTLDITITAPETPTFNPVGPFCQNATAPALPTSSTNATPITGTWSPATINTSVVGTSTYTFTPDAGQCAVNTTLNITITAPETPTFNPVGPFCLNATAPALPTSSTNATPIAGTWSPATINTSVAGTSTYTFTPDAGQCAVSTTMDIEITNGIIPTFNAIGPFCLNATAPALPTSSTNATPITGTWSPATINTSAIGTTTYTFTPNAGQCAVSTTMDIEITNSITPTFNAIGPFCLNATAPALPTSSTNATPITGTWSPATINTSAIGTTTYTFTPNAGQCAVSTTMDIEITNSLTPTFASIAPICQGSTAPSLPSSSTNSIPITGTWNPATINTSTVGTTTYTFTPDAGQCAVSTTMDIEIIATPPAPAISISANVTTICAGEMVDFTATPNSFNTGDVIQWFVNNTPIPGGTGLQFSSNTLTNTAQVTAVFTPSSSCLVGQTATSNLIIITVNPTTSPSVTINATSTQICAGQNVTFNATITGGGGSPQIQWMVNGNAVAGADSNTFSTTGLANSDIVTVVVTSNSPCANPNTATSNSLTIAVIPTGTPSIIIEADRTVICVGQHIILNATTTFGGSSPTYNWSVDGNNFTTTTPSFTASGLTANSTITCTLNSNYACATSNSAVSNTINIQVNPTPTVSVSDDATIQEGSSVNITAVATENMNYLWSPSEGLSCSDCLLPVATPKETTVYNISVTDPASGCSAVDSVKITVIKNFDIWIPTAFSPNGDGKNDILFVRGNNIKAFTLKIYDRWGTKLFETSDVAKGWDGEYNNRKVNTGIFVYVIDYTLNDGTSQTLKGNLTLSN
ncbi:MAG: gliding motility-associated C-terminal domain-containing protein [Bacteroidia bacterium]|nr:gliding motility-associated C-terminal domain-containing protein [Bacteroidia bacterium]